MSNHYVYVLFLYWSFDFQNSKPIFSFSSARRNNAWPFIIVAAKNYNDQDTQTVGESFVEAILFIGFRIE